MVWVIIFDDSISQIYDESNPDWIMSLKVNFPLENREARAEKKAAELSKARSLVALKNALNVKFFLMSQIRFVRAMCFKK